MDNTKFIEEYNAREDTTMTLGTNEYSDLVRNKTVRHLHQYVCVTF